MCFITNSHLYFFKRRAAVYPFQQYGVINDSSICYAGEGGLEVRGDGVGSTVLVDLHTRRPGRYGRYHPASSNSLR